MRQHDVPTACSCPLPDGHWGVEGWHYRVPSEDEICSRELWRRTRENSDLAALARMRRTASGHALEKIEAALEVVRREVRAFAAHYRGVREAYEPCPAYRAAKRRGIEEEKRNRRNQDDGEFPI